jgi:hypothetical protein
MTPKTKRTILFTVLCLVAIGAAVGYYLYTKKPLNPNDVSPDTTITSTELYKAFAADTAAAKKNFSRKNEVVEVSGIVSDISQNRDKQSIILLKSNVEGASVNCTMEGPVGNIKAGDSMRLKGFCTGMGVADADLGLVADVYMIRCYLMK